MGAKRKRNTSISRYNQSEWQPVSVLSYKDALKFLTDKNIEKIVEERHLTVGWQHASNVGHILRKTILASVGQYRQSINAIPLAIGKIQIHTQIFLIEDHNCIHLDISVHMVAFICTARPTDPLKCKAVMITPNSVVGKIFDIITVLYTPGIPNLKQGDIFEARFNGIHFNANLCQVKAVPLNTPISVPSTAIEPDVIKYEHPKEIKKEIIKLEDDNDDNF